MPVFEQEGQHAAWCSRHFLRQQVAALQKQGIETLAAGELEFYLLPEQDVPGHSGWHAYGIGGLLAHESMINDLVRTLEEANVGLEQFHAEYGSCQFELSLAPADPVTMVDRLVLTRILLGRIARKHHLRVSFSPRHLRMKQVTVLICITPLHVRGNLCWPAVPVSTVLPLRAGA